MRQAPVPGHPDVRFDDCQREACRFMHAGVRVDDAESDDRHWRENAIGPAVLAAWLPSVFGTPVLAWPWFAPLGAGTTVLVALAADRVRPGTSVA